jgi:hypothetical protein
LAETNPTVDEVIAWGEAQPEDDATRMMDAALAADKEIGWLDLDLEDDEDGSYAARRIGEPA